MPTTARGIWTPSDTDAVDFTTDLATMAGTIDNALDLYGNALRGTASQRTAFTSTAVNGMLWQDTDGVKMIWRRDTSVSGGWSPAVMRWRGTTAQMNSFGANAPVGFEWFSTTDNSEYVRRGGAWRKASLPSGFVSAPTGNLSAVGQNYGATFVATVPHAVASDERIVLTPTQIGAGYGQASQNGPGTVSGGNTLVPVRFIQLGSGTPQTVTFRWEVVAV